MADPKNTPVTPPTPPLGPTGPRLGPSRVSYKHTIAELQASLYQSRRSSVWWASLILLALGVALFCLFAWQFHSNYSNYRKIAAGKMDFNIEHRRLVASDLNAGYIYNEAAGQFRQPVVVRLTEKGETLLIITTVKGKVLEKRRVTRPDLSLENISTKYQNRFGETGNNVSLVYDSDGIARLVVSHTDS